MPVILVTAGVLVAAVAVYDLCQRKHAILRAFPVIGHLRYLLEAIRPEIQQYFIERNDDGRPFSHDQRRWVYATAKGDNASSSFGTDNDVEGSDGYLIVRHSPFPLPRPVDDVLPAAFTLGAWRARPLAVRPPSAVWISGMSYGSLSSPAVQALNEGAKLAGCWHNSGEGGLADVHRHGGELVFQIGTGYFGCRDDHGRFDLGRLVEVCATNPVRAIEIKLSQGAKPGLGGVLPAEKVTPTIAAVRGVRAGVTCHSPSSHSAFSDVSSMLDFVEQVADATGLPVGIKSAVGDESFFSDLAAAMASGARAVDYVCVDGGEGGTGSAPFAWADHVALPAKLALAVVSRAWAEHDLHGKVPIVASGKMGLPVNALAGFALGADAVAVGRTVMVAMGCIQAQRCHTGRCPTGVATQSPWLSRGLDPELKAVRVANYLTALRADLSGLAASCGVTHPSFVTAEHLAVLDGGYRVRSLAEAFDVPAVAGLGGDAAVAEVLEAVAAVRTARATATGVQIRR